MIIKKFFIARKELISNFFKSNIPNLEEFKEQVALEILNIENKIEKVSNSYSLCLRKCAVCDFVCTQFLYHEGKCDCYTNHLCALACGICKETSQCSLLNGHKNAHICNKFDHKCQFKCNIGLCEKNCTKVPSHDGTCRCSSSHPCGKQCKMFEKCGQLCKYDLTDPHIEHNCEGKCPFKCIFGDGKWCKSKNHFHDDKLTEVPDPFLPEKLIKSHICGGEHECIHDCESKGICYVSSVHAPKVYKNQYNEFTYSYVDLIAQKFKCGYIIKPKTLNHCEMDHQCTTKMHICNERCPDCNCFCDLGYGHGGLHKSDTHRNKECSQYIATDNIFEAVLNQNSTKTAITIVAGEPATPEFCDQYCVTKGRGHSHPIPCKGGDQCLQLTDAGFALHSNNNFKSSLNQSIFYDFVTCDTYWKKLGWLPPNFKHDNVQKIFGKCNYACGHSSHTEEGRPSLCEGDLFHTSSCSYSDHNFMCVHKESTNYDIVFIVDCTGSMGSTFPQVKKVIENLLNKWGNDTNKFAFVGYTDHYPDNGSFPIDIPVVVFPHSKNLSDGDPNKVASYIGNMTTSGGSRPGEALIDGLAMANQLIFRNDSSKMFILICDDTPHGDEFYKGTPYPKGCPCNHQWRTLLSRMKARNVNFIFVKLSEILNKTVQLFQDYYGQHMTVMNLNSVNEIEVKITNTVMATIEKSFVFSNKLQVLK